MKKHLLLIMALAATFALQAQWVDDPVNNNHLANCSEYGGEIYLATDVSSGDTYVQWCSGGSNGWAPTLQRLTYDGTPQWGEGGIRITGQNFLSSSDGVAMCATTDKAVVSCFATANDETVAVKVRSDGTFAWGEQGVVLFGGLGFSRTEVIAGDDGGVWALGFDYQQHYLQYIDADGTLNPTITISAVGSSVKYGKMTLGIGNTVFLTYEKTGSGFYTDKEMFLVGFTKEGDQIGPEVQLMASQSFQVTYLHHVVPDGLGGGYAYIWHSGIGGVFNTYVFHYDGNGFNTISNPNGIAVHSDDPANLYLDAYATVDPVTHDLIIAYIKVDAAFQSNDQIYVNRITSTGERVWGEGILMVDFEGVPYGNLRVDAFEDGSGFTLVYEKASANNDFNSTVEAMGVDMDGNQLWSKRISSVPYNKAMCRNSTGFVQGQNILAWVNSNSGGLYGQNIGTDGTMGYIEPVIPVPTCLAPENFDGGYVYDDETQAFGAMLTWTAPETQPLYYNLYITDPAGCTTNMVIEPTETSFYDETTVIGAIVYQLTAVYENCESDFALTADGEDHVTVEVTGIEENTDDAIIIVLKVYNTNGQAVATKSLDDLTTGLYILQGLTKDGRMVSKKVVVNK